MTDAQPVPEQWPAAPSQLLMFSCWAWHSVLWNIPLASSGQMAWTSFLWLLVHLLTSRNGKLGSSWLRVSNNQNISVLVTRLSYWIQNTALHLLLRRKLTPFQPKPGQYPPLIPYHSHHARSHTFQCTINYSVLWLMHKRQSFPYSVDNIYKICWVHLVCALELLLSQGSVVCHFGLLHVKASSDSVTAALTQFY